MPESIGFKERTIRQRGGDTIKMPGYSVRILKMSFGGLSQFGAAGSILAISTREQRLGAYEVWNDLSDATAPIIPVRAVKLCDHLEDYLPCQDASSRMTRPMIDAMTTVAVLKNMEAQDYQLYEIFGSYDGHLDVFRHLPHYARHEWDRYRVLNVGTDPINFWRALTDDYCFRRARLQLCLTYEGSRRPTT